MRYKIICFDMFQTLVDINACKYSFWKQILKEEYTKEKAEQLWNEALKISAQMSKDVKDGKISFKTMKELFVLTYKELYKKNNINNDVTKGVDLLIEQHKMAPVFSDAIRLFNILSADYRIWILSDTDKEMISSLLKLFKYEYALLSEDIKIYKQDQDNRFYKHVLSLSDINPQEIIHIGDGLTDIINPQKLGIKTCWINRDKKRWIDSEKPDYIIESFDELHCLLL